MKRWIGLLALIILFGIGLPQTSFADEEEGMSSFEKGEPVRHLSLLRSGRFEIQPIAQFGINETFQQTIGFGATLSFYFTNYLGLGATFAYDAIHINGDEIDLVNEDNYDGDVKSSLAIAHPRMNFDVGLYYVPVMGKFSLFGWILNYDLHIFGGFGALFMDAECGAGGTECELNTNNSLEGPKFAGVIGIGVRLFFNNFIALDLDCKNYLTKFGDFSRSPSDDRSRFKDYVTGNIGISIFLPSTVYMSR